MPAQTLPGSTRFVSNIGEPGKSDDKLLLEQGIHGRTRKSGIDGMSNLM